MIVRSPSKTNQVTDQTKHSLRKEVYGQTKQNPNKRKGKLLGSSSLFSSTNKTRRRKKKKTVIKYFARSGQQDINLFLV